MSKKKSQKKSEQQSSTCPSCHKGQLVPDNHAGKECNKCNECGYVDSNTVEESK